MARRRQPSITPATAAAAAVTTGGVLAAAGHAYRGRRRRRRRAYCLRADEPLADGIRRIAIAQIDLALGELEHAGTPAAVHEARKAIKRTRAVVRLARDEIGDDAYRRDNGALREAGRRLSGARDATVVTQTLDDLLERHAGALPSDAFAGLRDELAADCRAAAERIEEDESAIREATESLELTRANVATWFLDADPSSDALASAWRRIYRRARRATRAADAERTTEAFHELRKRTKDVWHAAEVLDQFAPKEFGRIANRAHKLSSTAGDDHDLAVLLQTARHHKLGPGELDLLERLVASRRAKLQARALKRGRRLYARRPRKAAAPVA